ncbi:MAG: Ig-like domain-containing protein, partial [Treponema sp.]|nr:Ig-like domain-containing protein [Treponema sp.]
MKKSVVYFAALAALVLATAAGLWSCMEARVISGELSPSVAAAARGGRRQFTATVLAEHGADTGVFWSLEGSGNPTFTTIDAGGLLEVYEHEPSNILTIRATSRFDPGKYREVAVTIGDTANSSQGALPMVTVSPEGPVTVRKGGTQQFYAAVTGPGNPAQGVTWSVDGVEETVISSWGLLSVAANETADKLVVRATSTMDPGLYDTTAVLIPPAMVSGITLSPPGPVDVPMGATLQFNATVTGTGNPSQDVTWKVTGNYDEDTGISPAGLLSVALNETAASLVVTAASSEDSEQTGEATVRVTAPQIPVRGVTLSGADTVAVGGSITLTKTFDPVNASNQNVTWSSTNSAVAYVAPDGTVTGLALGMAIIEVRTVEGNYTDRLTVTVTASPATVSLVTVSPKTASVPQGETQQFSATVTGTGSPSQDVTWDVTGGGAGTMMSADGLLIVAAAETAGKLMVTATSTVDTSVFGMVEVGVTIPVTGVTLNSTATVAVGATTVLTAVVAPVNASNKGLSWSSSNAAVAYVDANNGTVRGMAAGTAIIEVRTVDGNKTAACTVTVTTYAKPVTGVTMTVSAHTMGIGDTYQLTANTTPTDATHQNKTWFSYNPGIAYVDANGKVTGMSVGVVDIEATTEDGGYKTHCTITVTGVAVSGVAVSPKTPTVVRGASQQFSATVTGTNSPPQTVTWTVTGGSTGTSISADGLL